jgi:hypothetical protein
MRQERQDLGRRAVDCKGWRWMPGMRNGRDGSRYMGDDQWAWSDPYRAHVRGIECDEWPDFSDPATLGGLLALVREVREDPLICAYVDNTGCGWWLDGWADSRLYGDLHDTEAAALVAALEAAPCKRS